MGGNSVVEYLTFNQGVGGSIPPRPTTLHFKNGRIIQVQYKKEDIIMPNGDGTGPDGKGPKKDQKGWPDRYQEKKQGLGRCGRGLRQRNGSCQQQSEKSTKLDR